MRLKKYTSPDKRCITFATSLLARNRVVASLAFVPTNYRLSYFNSLVLKCRILAMKTEETLYIYILWGRLPTRMLLLILGVYYHGRPHFLSCELTSRRSKGQQGSVVFRVPTVLWVGYMWKWRRGSLP